MQTRDINAQCTLYAVGKIKQGKGLFAFQKFKQFFKNKSTEHVPLVHCLLDVMLYRMVEKPI